jgi:hypothetical protein
MRGMVIYEYEAPGGALNLNSTNYPDHGHCGEFSFKEKSPWQNQEWNLMISSQKL